MITLSGWRNMKWRKGYDMEVAHPKLYSFIYRLFYPPVYLISLVYYMAKHVRERRILIERIEAEK